MKNPKLPDQSSPGGDAETVKNMIQLIDLRIDKIEKEWNHANRQYFKCAELDNEMLKENNIRINELNIFRDFLLCGECEEVIEYFKSEGIDVNYRTFEV